MSIDVIYAYGTPPFEIEGDKDYINELDILSKEIFIEIDSEFNLKHHSFSSYELFDVIETFTDNDELALDIFENLTSYKGVNVFDKK